MSDDSRVRYIVLQPLSTTDGRVFWLRVGHAYRNRDGTIDGYFETIVVGNRFWLRKAEPGDVNGVQEGGRPS